MTWRTGRFRRYVAAFVAAASVGVVGVSTLSDETAQAAGVVVEHRPYAAPAPAALPRKVERKSS